MRFTTKDLVLTSIMTAILCVLGPVSIPIGPVPVSLTTFLIFTGLYILGYKRCTVSVLIYILLGTSGLPVFSGFQGGLAKVTGPTGGYILGFIPMVLVAGLIIDKLRNRPALCPVVTILSSWIVYIPGSLWLSYSTGISFGAAMLAGVVPFIVLDIIKALLAFAVGMSVYRRLMRAGDLIS